MIAILAERWWALAIRGLAAIIFGILTFVFPGLSVYALVILFGAWAFADGIFNVIAAVRRAGGKSWGWMLFEGLASIAAGVVTFFWPGLTAFALLMVIAAWSFATGIAEIVAAIRLRKFIRNEWLLGLAGVLSVVFGLLLFAYPGAGALALVFWIGAFAIVFGALLIALAFRLRAWARDPSHRVPPPPEHAPMPA